MQFMSNIVLLTINPIDLFLKVRYTPLAPGHYFLSVKYNGAHIVGSPFKIECTGKYEHNALWSKISYLISH